MSLDDRMAHPSWGLGTVLEMGENEEPSYEKFSGKTRF